MFAELEKRLNTVKSKTGTTRFIAIDGHGGSGKSTLASLIAKKLEAEVIHTDDFASWDNPLDWWPLVIERIFRPIIKGEHMLSYSRSKWWEDHNPEPVIEQPVTRFMILEGVGALRKEFRPYLSFGIFVDTPQDVCAKRGIERDKVTGKSESELSEIWQKWFQQEQQYMQRDRPKEYANLVVSGLDLDQEWD